MRARVVLGVVLSLLFASAANAQLSNTRHAFVGAGNDETWEFTTANAPDAQFGVVQIGVKVFWRNSAAAGHLELECYVPDRSGNRQWFLFGYSFGRSHFAELQNGIPENTRCRVTVHIFHADVNMWLSLSGVRDIRLQP